MPRGDSDQPDYMPLYEEAGQKHHVDPDLLGAVGDVESHQDRYAESPAGAGGLMQLMPGTAEELNVTDRFDPRQSVFGGTRYLRRQLDSFHNVNDALSAYNAGPNGNWDNEETQNYVEAVNARWHARRMARLQRQQQPAAAPEAPPPSGGLFDDVLHKQSAASSGGLFDDVLPQQKQPPAQQSLPPAQRDEAAPPAPARDAGWLETAQEAAKAPFRGARQTFQTALTGRPGEEAPPPNIEAAQPITVEDFKHPLTLGKKALYGVVSSSPEMAAFFGTSWLGGGPETPPGIAVGSLGAALAHSMTTFGPAFGAELRQTPSDPDGAFHRAFVKTGIGAVATGVGFELFGAVNPFEGALKNLAFQVFGVQPAVSAGEQVATNVNEGRPTLEGVAEGYFPSVIGSAVPIVGFEGAKLAGRGVQAVTDAMRPVPAPLQAGLNAQRQGAAGAQGQPGAPPPPPQGPPPPPQGPPPPPMGPPPPPQGPPEAPHGPPPPPQGPPPPPQGAPPPPAAPPPTNPQGVLVDIARGGDGAGNPPTNPPAANPPLTPPPSPAPEAANPPVSPLTRPPEGEPATRPMAPPEATPPPPTSGSYVMLRPDQLNVDPARFQYKAADESGVTGVLRGAKKWESDLADPILAWQDNDGKMWVVNGHQRTDLARRAEAAGQEGIQIPARIIREADGYTPAYARALGAYVNIAQGSGTAIDAAKVLRAVGSLPPSLRDRLPQLSTTGAIMRDASGLVKLGDEAFGAVVNGVIEPAAGAHVGNLISDPAMQMAAIQVLHKANPANSEQARMIVQDVRNQEMERQREGDQGSLMGFEPQATSLVPQRAQVLDYVTRLLKQAKSRYSGAIKGETTLTNVEGNKINVEGTKAAKSDNEQLIDKLEKNALVRGPISDALTAAARDLAGGQPIAQVGARFLASARAIDPGAGAEGLQRGADHGGADQARSGEGKGPEGEGPEPPVEGQEGFFQRKVPLPLPSGEDLFGAQRPAPQRREADPLFQTDQRQQAMPGMDPTAQQAQASRDQAGRGALLPKKDQQALDFGLFGKPQAEQGDLLAPRSATNLAPKTSRWQEPRFTDEMHTVHWPPDVNGHAVGRDWTVERGKQTGNEHILITALDGTVLHAGTGNEKSFAPFDAGEHLKGMAPDSVVIHHNHPSGGALSDQDVYMLTFPQISHVVAHGSDGRGLTYSATLGLQGRQWRATEPWDVVYSRLRLAFQRAEDTALRVLSTAFQQGRITEEDFRKHYWDVVHRVVSLDSTTHYLSRNELPAPVMLALMRYTHDVLGIRYDPTANRYANATDADRRVAGLDRARGGQPVQGPSATAGSGAENPGVDRQSGQGPRPVQGRLLEGFAEREEEAPLFARRKKANEGEPSAQLPLTHQAAGRASRQQGAVQPPGAVPPEAKAVPSAKALADLKAAQSPGIGDAAPAVTPEAQRARDTLTAASRGVMRWLGLPETVGLHFVDHLLSGGADGSYQHNLITYALDTASSEAPIKFWHEAVHALRDKSLGLLTDAQNKALDVAADRWLKDPNEGQQRQFEMRSQGITDPIEMREEAIAQMAEEALRQGERGRTLMGAVAHLWRNFGRGIGQMLRGQGYHTADDVFAALMRGGRATPTAAGDLVSAALGRATAPGDGQSQPRAAAGEEPTAPLTGINAKDQEHVVNGTAIRLPGTYFAMRRGDAADQGISSAGTSQRQIAATVNKVDWKSGTRNADIGGGRYDDTTHAMAAKGVTNLVVDPFNRPDAHNARVADEIARNPTDTATVNSVLNVIPEAKHRLGVIQDAARAIKPDGAAHFLIYEGDKSGTGKVTKVQGGQPGSWQNNRKADAYMDEIRQHFGDVQRKGNLITARQPKPGGEDQPLFSRRTPQWLQNRTQTSAVARAAVAIDDARERISDSVMHVISPMTQGSKRAMDHAFRFASAMRAIQYEYGRLDRSITRDFDPAARARMGTAMDNESVFEQQLAQPLHPPPSPAMVAQMRAAFDAGGTGIAGLAPNERAVVQQLAQLAQGTWQRMQSRGMVAPGADGLPFYFARQIILRGPGDEISSSGGAGGGRDINEIGKNLTTQGAMKRKYLTPQETEKAARAALGQNAELLTDVRSLIQRLASQERGVAGTDLINAIERIGQQTGVNTVVRGTIPGMLNPADYFTLNHPSFRRFVGSGFEQTHIAREFEGPLRAVLSEKTSDVYDALMKAKGFSMHMIMISPFMHLAVEVGRALPLMRGKLLTFQTFFTGNRLMQNETYMREAIRNGLAPIAQGWSLDPVRIAEEAQVGRTFIDRLRQNPIGNAAVEAWDWWSRRVLWDNVFRLQVGIYDHVRNIAIDKGYNAQAASVIAGHFANRYAGALPHENLSRLTNQAANLLMFSRSFTLGNLGVMKDMLNGAPQHVRATLEGMVGTTEAERAAKFMARKAQSAFILDVGIMFVANAVLQLGTQTVIRGWSMGMPAAAQDVYDEWLKQTKASFSKIGENPLNAFGFLPNVHNEPNKRQRIYVGNDSEGRGTYVRFAAGKIGEEFLGWFTHPGDMVLNKMSPMVRPIGELVMGEDTLHRQILKPDPTTIGDYMANAGRVVKHLFQGQLPMTQLSGISDWRNPHRDPYIAGIKTLLPFTGLGQLSSGYPGGPEAGKIAGYKRSTQFDIKQAYPAATRAAQSGAPDAIATAARILRDAGEEDPKQAFKTARFLANPAVAAARSRGRYLRTHPGAREAMEE